MDLARRWIGRASWLLLATVGCGGGNHHAVDAAAPECAQGGSYSCVGPGGCQGGQLCMANGRLSPCECQSTPTQGSAGTSASDGGKPDAAKTGTSPADAGQVDAGSATHPTDAGKQAIDSGSGVSEDCSNGVDDDGDGKIDCADSDCGAWMCLGETPADWSGPTPLYVGSAQAPACSGRYTSAALRGGTAASATAAVCSTCTCSPSAPCASFLSFLSGAQSNCSDAACTAMVDPASACVELAPSCLTSLTTGYVQTQLPPGVASCMPSAQSATIDNPTWTEHVLACAPSDPLRRGGCNPGSVCAPQAPFSGPFCIVKQGDVPCPSGPYTDRRVYFTAVDDTRKCSDCSCGSDCSYSWKIFDDADTTCQTPLATKTSAGECVTVTPSSGKIRVSAAISGTGTCTPGGGQPTGTATANGPVTACCVP